MRLFIRPYVAPIRRIRPISHGRIEAHSMRLFIRPYVAPIRPFAITPLPHAMNPRARGVPPREPHNVRAPMV